MTKKSTYEYIGNKRDHLALVLTIGSKLMVELYDDPIQAMHVGISLVNHALVVLADIEAHLVAEKDGEE